MKTKKLVLTILILILSLSLIAASLSAAKYYTIKKGETVEFTSGRAGVSFTKSQFTGTVKLARITDGNAPGETKPDFTQKLLDVRLSDSKGNRITHILGSVYVFFKVRRSEVRDWDEGALTIYFYDTWTQEWTPCDTFEVVDDHATTRLGCRMRVFGLYGLGQR